MAKLVITYENETIKKEITFRNETYILTMQPCKTGKISLEKGLEDQYQDKHGQDEDLEEIMEAFEVIGYGDDDEIEEALGQLSEFE